MDIVDFINDEPEFFLVSLLCWSLTFLLQRQLTMFPSRITCTGQHRRGHKRIRLKRWTLFRLLLPKTLAGGLCNETRPLNFYTEFGGRIFSS